MSSEKESLYDAIAKVEDLPTRKILFIEFIHRYYPEAYEALLGHNKLVVPMVKT